MEIEDRTGEPLRDEEIQRLRDFVISRMRPDKMMKDPELGVNLLTMKTALEELMILRARKDGQ